MSDPYKTRQSLLVRLREQYDDNAWEQFNVHYGYYIYSVIRRMNIDHHDAQDIQQDVLLKIWKKLPEYEYRTDKSLFRSWVATVTRNAVVSHIRKQQTQSKTKDAAAQDSADHLSSIDLPDIEAIIEEEWRSNISNLAFDRIEKRFVGNAVEAFKMSLAGATNEQIANKLDLTENTIRQLKYRVKKQLATEIRFLRDDLE